MKSENTVIGLVAHVDAGKTTLSEALLYDAGALRERGRVDKGNAFLDTHEIEKRRGITVFSKEARFFAAGRNFILADTPGHRDFTGEMLRTLGVLDCAVLIVNGAEGIEEQTSVIWKLLGIYGVPRFIFVNKMDLVKADRRKVERELIENFGDSPVPFDARGTHEFEEALAMADPHIMEKYLAGETISEADIAGAIKSTAVSPVVYGSALKGEGVKELMELIAEFTEPGEYPEEFSAEVYRVTRDKKGTAEAHVRVTGGVLKAKQPVGSSKIARIVKYSGRLSEQVNEVKAGDMCAISGVGDLTPGDVISAAGILHRQAPDTGGIVWPRTEYRLVLAEGENAGAAYIKLAEMQTENPELDIRFSRLTDSVYMKARGILELDLFRETAAERFGIVTGFAEADMEKEEAEETARLEALAEAELMEELGTEEAEEDGYEQQTRESREESELDRIFTRTYGKSKRDEQILRENRAALTRGRYSSRLTGSAERNDPERIIIIDGYNVVFAWEELKALAKENIDSAREALLDVLENYYGYKKVRMTVVFDGYRPAGNPGSSYDYSGIETVFTKAAETADSYIARTVHELGKKANVTVVTSDRLVQLAAQGDGGRKVSASDFRLEVMNTSEEIRQKLRSRTASLNRPLAELLKGMAEAENAPEKSDD